MKAENKTERTTSERRPKGVLYEADYIILAWLTGMLCTVLLGCFVSVWIFVLLFVLLIILYSWRYHQGKSVLLVMMAMGILLGALRWNLYDRFVRQPLLAMDGETVTCSGTITRLSRYANDGVRYTLRMKLAGHATTVDWYTDSKTGLYEIGDTVLLDAKLTYAVRRDGIKETDWEGSGKYLRIYKAELLEIKRNTGFSLRRSLWHYRQRIQQIIENTLLPTESGILCGMLFGDRSGISEESSDALSHAGIGHILTVSGLHVMFFCSLLYRFLRMLQIPTRLAFYIEIPMLAVFLLLVDASASVFRAVSMMLLYQFAEQIGRYGSTRRSLTLTMWLFTFFSPYLIISASFWLSVAGTAGIALFAPYMTAGVDGKFAELRKNFYTMCCVALAVFPVSILFFGESSLLSPLCNLLILPLGTISLYLGFGLLLSGGLLRFLLYPAGIFCFAMHRFAMLVAAIPFSALRVTSEPVRWMIYLSALLVLVMVIRHCKVRTVVLTIAISMAMIPILTIAENFLHRNQVALAVFGSKEPQVLVLTTQNEAVAIDITGARKNAGYVETYLEAAGINQVRALYVPTLNAAASYQAVFGEIKVGQVSVGSELGGRPDLLLFGGIQPTYTQGMDYVVTLGEIEMALRHDEVIFRMQGKQIDLTEYLDTELIFDSGGGMRTRQLFT